MTRGQDLEAVEQFSTRHCRDADVRRRNVYQMLFGLSVATFDDVTADVRVEHVQHQSSSRKSGSRSFEIRFIGRSFIQSSGISIPRTNSKNSSQACDPRFSESMTLL